MLDDTSMIGARVRAARARQGMSLGRLAEATGLSKAFLSRAERGERGLDRYSTVQKIAEALHVPLTELTGQPYQPRSAEDVRARTAVADLRDILHGLHLGDPVEVPQRPLPELERATWRVRQLSIASDYGGFGPLLPPLVLELHAAAATDPAAHPQVLPLLMSAVHAGLWLAQGLGADDLMSLAAQRAADAAARLDDPAATGYAQWLVWLASLRYGRYTQARAVQGAEQAAARLQPQADTGPAAEMYGMMHLVQAYSTMLDGHPGRAADHLDEAGQTAARTGDTTSYDVWFGPTEVAAWRVSIAVEAGDDEGALQAASDVDTRRMASPSRRASHLLDRARASVRSRRARGQATDLLMQAERLAPQYMRGHPGAREAVSELLVTAGGTDLRSLAKRVGVIQP
jgi:transcriptional regulator with XRE-family HTH domain